MIVKQDEDHLLDRLASMGVEESSVDSSVSPSKAKFVAKQKISKEDESGIAIPKGATVALVEKTDTGWWFVEYDGKEGALFFFYGQA